MSDSLQSNLRENIEDNPSKPMYIQTVWGVGYRLHSGQLILENIEESSGAKVTIKIPCR